MKHVTQPAKRLSTSNCFKVMRSLEAAAALFKPDPAFETAPATAAPDAGPL